jgi:hypothetical protein
MKTIKCIFLMLVLSSATILFNSCEKDSNSDPVISEVIFNPATINANGTTNVSVSASDPNGDNLTYTYSVSGGTITGAGADVIWSAPAMQGEHTLTATADDGQGGQVTKTVKITILEPVTQISGIASLQGGGYLSDAKVYLYAGYPTAASPIKTQTVNDNGFMAVFNFTGITPGDYYVLLWKDCDKNGSASVGDYIGWYGTGIYQSPTYTKITVADRETFQCYMKVYTAQ